MFSDQFRRGESEKAKLTGVKSSKVLSNLSGLAWKAFQSVNKRLPEGEAIRPNWAPGPLLKSYERSAPPLGFPRETDSLCPTCVKEVRNAVISGETPLETLMYEHPGEIKAQIVEENGQVVMRKTCPKHGEFVDVMATDPLSSSALNRSSSVVTSGWRKMLRSIITELPTSSLAAAPS